MDLLQLVTVYFQQLCSWLNFNTASKLGILCWGYMKVKIQCNLANLSRFFLYRQTLAVDDKLLVLKKSTCFRAVTTRHLSKFDQPCQQISAPDFILNQRPVQTTSSSWWAKSNGSAEKQPEVTLMQPRVYLHRTFQHRNGITFPIRPLSKSPRKEYSKVKLISYFTNEFNKVTESYRKRRSSIKLPKANEHEWNENERKWKVHF